MGLSECQDVPTRKLSGNITAATQLQQSDLQLEAPTATHFSSLDPRLCFASWGSLMRRQI
jgi:hypothetical protein